MALKNTLRCFHSALAPLEAKAVEETQPGAGAPLRTELALPLEGNQAPTATR